MKASGHVRVTPKPADLRVETYPPNVTVSEHGEGRDEVRVDKYEQLAMFAETPQELAKAIVDWIAAQARQTDGQTDSPVKGGTERDS
jgi:hypothetical protein